jgi:hypothetical protein
MNRKGERLKYTVRLTRKELIVIESLLRCASQDMLNGITAGFNEAIGDDKDIRRIAVMDHMDAERLADRLLYIEQEWNA